jgi:DNA-binding protein HU-beta
MNQSDLIDTIASKANISKRAAARTMNSLVDAIRTTLNKGEVLTLRGFGTFSAGGNQRSNKDAQAGREPKPIDQADLEAIENTLTEVRRYIRSRDRTLRQAAINNAGGICVGCKTNFGAFLGGLGARVLQVHHRKQLAASNAPAITGVKDLVVVCANCHMLIHADPKKAMSIMTLRRRLAVAEHRSPA